MIDVSFIRILYHILTFFPCFAYAIFVLTRAFSLIAFSMPVKSTIWEDVVAPFPLLFLLVAFCPIGRGICDGVPVFETSIGVSRFNNDEYALEA